MLEKNNRFLFAYVMDRDFGFAPNPFHGYCTLATCKPGIRKAASPGDWVMGVGGSRLNAKGRCIYLMKVTEITTFDEYWNDERFLVKRPLRNGSTVMMVGDNIYHRCKSTGQWNQEDSHHSNSDGSPNMQNVTTDTRSERVLLSSLFYYFGKEAPQVDLKSISFNNIRNFRKLSLIDDSVGRFIASIEVAYAKQRNAVVADPIDFSRAHERVDQSSGKLT